MKNSERKTTVEHSNLKIQNIKEISKDVMNIDESKYFIDQQEIVLDENSFGENCK